MMMSLATPSEREMVVYNIDDRELKTCQLKKGVLSEWQIICLRNFQS